MFVFSTGAPAFAKEASEPVEKPSATQKGDEVKAKAQVKVKGPKAATKVAKRKGVLPRRKKPGKPKLSPKTQKARKELLDLFKDPPK
jgi:hypothetical protein